jgi:hypothetical protein
MSEPRGFICSSYTITDGRVSFQAFTIHVLTNRFVYINILGYVTEEDNIIKITDGKLANELLDIMYDEHMNPRGSDIRMSH